MLVVEGAKESLHVTALGVLLVSDFLSVADAYCETADMQSCASTCTHHVTLSSSIRYCNT